MNRALRTRAGPYLTNLRKVTFMSVRRVALLTAGGFAPCLSSAVGGLIERYNEIDPSVEIIAYQNGYHGLLTGNYVLVDEEARKHAAVLHRYGGSPIGNSRVKLTNKKNLVERGLVAEDEDPLQKAAEQLRTDGVDVLHTIGGDDTNHDGRRPCCLPGGARLPPDRRGPAQDHRQ